MVEERGVTADALATMWAEVALLLRGTLVRCHTLTCLHSRLL
jgi:hypothetical protein